MDNNRDYEPLDVFAGQENPDKMERIPLRKEPIPGGVHRPARRRSRRSPVMVIIMILALLAALVMGLLYAGAQSDLRASAASNQALSSENGALHEQLTDVSSKAAHYEEELGIPGGEPDTENMDSSQLASTLQQRLDRLNSKTNDLRSQINALQPPSSVPTGTTETDGRKVAYLTFDDGPSSNTEKILDILKQYNAKATFFVIGTSKLDLIKRIHEEGHTVGLHSNSHEYNQIYSSVDAYFKDLQAISDKVESYIGVAPKVIRFPGGSSNTVSAKYCKGIMSQLTKEVEARGYVYFDWNVSSGDADANKAPASDLVANIKRECGKKSRVCILMHDAPIKTTTVDALPEIIQYLQGEGYSLEALTTDVKPFHHGVNN